MVNLDYLFNSDAVKKIFFDRNYFSDKKLSFSIIENGMILPHKLNIPGIKNGGGIVDGNGEYIKSSFWHYGFGQAYTPPRESILHRSETVIYLGFFFHVWGHAITDNIRRLWFLQSDDFKESFKNCPLVYITWEGKPLEGQRDFTRLLEILEIDVERLQPITQPTQFDKIILPDESWYSIANKNYWISNFTNEYRETIDRVRHFAMKNRTPTSAKKFYFFYGNKQFGEERLAEYFKSKGYSIITHEQRADVDEELNMLINAESFAAPVGSCSHNSVFMRDDTETILIPRASDAFTFYQQALDQVHPQNTNYVSSTMSVFNIGLTAYFFMISEQLTRFFGDKFEDYAEGNFEAFLNYVKSPVRCGRPINPRQVNGYGAVFQDFLDRLKQREDLIKACDMPSDWDTFRQLLVYRTHVHMRGWRDGWQSENQFSNPLEQKLDVLAIMINFPNHNVYYSVYFSDAEGWSKEVSNSEMAGTVGVRKPIYGMKIRLDDNDAEEFDILYRMHKFDDTWTPWAKNGEELLSGGVKLNAIQIKLESKT